MIADVAYPCRRGREVIYDAEHFFDGFKANPDYAAAAFRRRPTPGPTWSSCATPTAARLPDDIAAAVPRRGRSVPVPVGIHCHNDCELAVANTLAAVTWRPQVRARSTASASAAATST